MGDAVPNVFVVTGLNAGTATGINGAAGFVSIENLTGHSMMDSLAIRIPAHRNLQKLLDRLGRPLTSTSANLSGDKPVSNPEMLKPILKNRPSLIIDDGILPGGSPSTIVRIETDGVVVLRQGAYPVDRLAEALPIPVFSAGAAEISADDSLETR